MTDYQTILTAIRNHTSDPPAGLGHLSSKTVRTVSYELVQESGRKDGRELLQFGVDHLEGGRGWSIYVAHTPVATEGNAIPTRDIWVAPDQVPTLLDLLEAGMVLIQDKPGRALGSPKVREEVGTADSSLGSRLLVVLQGYENKWNLKITGSNDQWLPFDVRDWGAFKEGFALAVERLDQLDDGIPF